MLARKSIKYLSRCRFVEMLKDAPEHDEGEGLIVTFLFLHYLMMCLCAFFFFFFFFLLLSSRRDKFIKME